MSNTVWTIQVQRNTTCHYGNEVLGRICADKKSCLNEMKKIAVKECGEEIYFEEYETGIYGEIYLDAYGKRCSQSDGIKNIIVITGRQWAVMS